MTAGAVAKRNQFFRTASMQSIVVSFPSSLPSFRTRATWNLEASSMMFTSDLFNICLHNDDVQDFDARWDQILSGTSEMLPENVLEGLHRNKLQCSEQLQAVFAMSNPELNRDQEAPSCQKLRNMVRQHVAQTISTRNFKARNERIETGVLVKGHKGRNVSAERKVGDCFQWKANGQCSNLMTRDGSRSTSARSSESPPRRSTS